MINNKEDALSYMAQKNRGAYSELEKEISSDLIQQFRTSGLIYIEYGFWRLSLKGFLMSEGLTTE